MRFTLERVSDPDIECIELADMKRHLRMFVTDTSEDDDVDGVLTPSAREWAEDFTGRALIDQTWRLTLHGRAGTSGGGDIVSGHRGPGPVNYGYYSGAWRCARPGEIALRRTPILAVTSFVTVDSAGEETEIDAATYEIREPAGKYPRIVALAGALWSMWLQSDLRITFRAGYADRTGSPQQGAEMVPQRFIQAMKLWATAHYAGNDPSNIPEIVKAAENLLMPLCVDLQMA